MGDSGDRRTAWNDLAARLLDLEPAKRRQDPALGKLFEQAMQIGVPILVKRGIDQENAQNLIAERFIAKVDLVIARHDPFAYFLTLAKNCATSWLRKKSSEVVEAQSETSGSDPTSALEAKLHLPKVLAHKRFRDDPRLRRIFGMLAAGEDREDIAKALGIKRPNVDQLIKRTRDALETDGLL